MKRVRALARARARAHAHVARQVWAIFAPKLVWEVAILAAADAVLLLRS